MESILPNLVFEMESMIPHFVTHFESIPLSKMSDKIWKHSRHLEEKICKP